MSGFCEFYPPEAKPDQPTTTTSTTTPTIVECDFENENLCGWEIVASPPNLPFEWERTNGKTLEDNSIDGPYHDHAEQKESNFCQKEKLSLYF